MITGRRSGCPRGTVAGRMRAPGFAVQVADHWRLAIRRRQRLGGMFWLRWNTLSGS